MDTITISAEWWCPQKKVVQTRKAIADEIGKLAASHVSFDVTEYGAEGCLVRGELHICVRKAHGKES